MRGKEGLFTSAAALEAGGIADVGIPGSHSSLGTMLFPIGNIQSCLFYNRSLKSPFSHYPHRTNVLGCNVYKASGYLG